ncbi:hypothetical protein [Stenotrophomonas sp. JAG2]|uniref:hypothetical protein n=1 Tax=Stenotrophomonas sp. JAG2 TaxID=3229243 RepID=UPI0034E2F5FD
MSATRSLFIACLLPLAGCNQLAAVNGPKELVSFGHVRPVSCERKAAISYNCVMKNHSDALRSVSMECASFDGQGRAIGKPRQVYALRGVTFSPGEERIAPFFYDDGAAAIVCMDIEGNIPPYGEIQALLDDPKLKQFTTVLSL